MNCNKSFNLKIINKKDYKIYYFDLCIDEKTNEVITPNINDINIWIIMTDYLIKSLVLYLI